MCHMLYICDINSNKISLRTLLGVTKDCSTNKGTFYPDRRHELGLRDTNDRKREFSVKNYALTSTCTLLSMCVPPYYPPVNNILLKMTMAREMAQHLMKLVVPGFGSQHQMVVLSHLNYSSRAFNTIF